MRKTICAARTLASNSHVRNGFRMNDREIAPLRIKRRCERTIAARKTTNAHRDRGPRRRTVSFDRERRAHPVVRKSRYAYRFFTVSHPPRFCADHIALEPAHRLHRANQHLGFRSREGGAAGPRDAVRLLTGPDTRRDKSPGGVPRCCVNAAAGPPRTGPCTAPAPAHKLCDPSDNIIEVCHANVQQNLQQIFYF